MLRENSAFPFPAKESFLFSQDQMPKTVRGNRIPNKNLINAFIIPILILRKNRLYLIQRQIACQKRKVMQVVQVMQVMQVGLEQLQNSRTCRTAKLFIDFGPRIL
jgi:hypothetical protein